MSSFSWHFDLKFYIFHYFSCSMPCYFHTSSICCEMCIAIMFWMLSFDYKIYNHYEFFKLFIGCVILVDKLEARFCFLCFTCHISSLFIWFYLFVQKKKKFVWFYLKSSDFWVNLSLSAVCHGCNFLIIFWPLTASCSG